MTSSRLLFDERPARLNIAPPQRKPSGDETNRWSWWSIIVAAQHPRHHGRASTILPERGHSGCWKAFGAPACIDTMAPFVRAAKARLAARH